MTRYLLGALTIAMFTGCPHTGIDSIDDTVHAKNACEHSFTVSNASSATVNIHMDITEATSDRNCDSSGDHQTLTVPAGQTATVKANINCEICDVYEAYSVDSTNPSVTYLGSKLMTTVDGDTGSENAVCTDSGCSGT